MMLAMLAGENRDDWDDLLPAIMMAYRSSVHKSTGFSPYHLMFREECTLPMDVGLPRRDQDLPDPIKNPYALWVRDTLEVAYDQVRRHSGQAFRRQKRLYDKRAVRRLFAVGDWIVRYYPLAKKCKLDSPWIGPYLVVYLVGWAVGVQLHPDSPILLVHCQDLKKIPCPRGLVSWIDVHLPDSSPVPPVLGTSMVCRSTRGSASPTGSVACRQHSDDRIVDSTQPSPGSVLDGPGVSNMNLSSLARSRVVAFLPQEARDIDDDHVLHLFFHHRLDVGPIRLTSIAHAFNYRIVVLRHGAKLAARVGRSQRAARQILDDVDIPWGHQVAVMFQMCARWMEVPAVLLELGQLKGVSPNVNLACEPWGHMNHGDGDCECLSLDQTGAYVHELALVTSSSRLNFRLRGVAGCGFFQPIRSFRRS